MFLDVSTELLKLGYSIRFRPSGRSMYPTIRDGEAVTVEPVSAPDGIRRGDILLYSAERKLTAHRVRLMEKTGDKVFFHLRGDASVSFDEPVEAAQVLGRVVAVERDGRAIDLTGRRARLEHTARISAVRLKTLLNRGRIMAQQAERRIRSKVVRT